MSAHHIILDNLPSLVGDIRQQIAAEWLQIRQWSQQRAYRKLPSLFPVMPSLIPYDLPFLPKWGFDMPLRYANGRISATGDPIHFMFGFRVKFSGSADRMALFMVRTNPIWRPPPCWKNFKWRYLHNRSFDPRHVLFQGEVFGDDRSNGAISGSNKSKMAAAAILKKIQMAIIRNRSYISATAHDLLIQRASRGHLCDSTAFLFYMSGCYIHAGPEFIIYVFLDAVLLYPHRLQASYRVQERCTYKIPFK